MSGELLPKKEPERNMVLPHPSVFQFKMEITMYVLEYSMTGHGITSAGCGMIRYNCGSE